jgi:hypothetical protein
METAASFEVRNAPSSYPTVADDARTREVSPRRSVRWAAHESGGFKSLRRSNEERRIQRWG